EISEGRKQVVGTIVFEGNKAFPASRLRKLMKVRVRRWPLSLGHFKEELFEADIQAIERFYKSQGYLDVSVSKSQEPEERRRLLLRVRIEEGKQYYLGKINFSGNLIFPESQLRKHLVLAKEGEVFDESKAEENLAKLQRVYFDRGYIQARIQSLPEPVPGTTRIDLVYLVEPGNIFTVDEVVIRGNTRTKDKVIRREVSLVPGDAFSGFQLEKSFGRLRDLNYFDDIKIFPEFSLSADKANLVVEVKEKEKTGLLMFGGGFSTVDKLVGMVSLEQTNFDLTNFPTFTGGGQNLKMWLQLGQVNQGFYLSFTEPYFLDRPVWLGTDAYHWTRDWDEYSEKRTGGDIRVGRRWEDFSLGFTLKSERVSLSDITIPSIVDQTGKRWKNSLATNLEYSKVDSRLLPTRGFSAVTSLEYAGGVFQGDLNFWKATLEGNFYYPLPFKKTIFHTRTYLAKVNELGDTADIPIYERFFGGGIGTVRGYEERSLGPLDPTTGEAIGGKTIFAQTFEVLYPIYQDILKGVVFFDVGNVWERDISFSDLRKGVGAGIRVTVPLFRMPIQLDYGLALDRKKGEDRGRRHIGMTFGF
ncbi:MAG: outer membrane protein assembly factor BamA, partial [Candidatus Omnitrophica bacterium]|nr:outer membrane protein assembly factor BamA [Candidatus Omnitrophota bacterium]